MLAFVDDLRVDPRLPKDPHEEIVVSGRILPPEEDKRFVTHGAERDRALSREGVAFGKDGDHRLAEDRHDREFPLGHGQPHESDLKPPRPQPLELLSRWQNFKGEMDPRISFAERRQYSRKYAQLGRCHVADGESPNLAAFRPDRDLCGTIGLGEGAARLNEKQASGICEIDAPAGSLQEPNSELSFKTPDLLAERRLSDMKPLCRASEVQHLRNSDEVAQVSELHESIS